MDYQAAIDFLYNSLPAFERQGVIGYKPGLERVEQLAEAFGNPHRSLKCIHIAGTNGKGSTAHLLASVLQCAGYKVGLFTSPHLVDFTERIRIDGIPVDHNRIVDFVCRYQDMHLGIYPSFFELTTIMAFDIFARENVDYAVIETGLGGRLDSTNIITPILSVITNVDFDHTDLLGDTLESIAGEKAGIIKAGVPVIVSESAGVVRDVMQLTATLRHSPIFFADQSAEIVEADTLSGVYYTSSFGELRSQLTGACQLANARGVLEAIKALTRLGVNIPASAVRTGFASVMRLTGLRGRWTEISMPGGATLVYDTGHNPAGWRYTVERLRSVSGRLKMVLGFVADKDVASILGMISENLPHDTACYITQPESHRALPATDLCKMAQSAGLSVADCETSVCEAVRKAKEGIAPGDTLFIGGSNYLIGDWLSSLSPQAHP